MLDHEETIAVFKKAAQTYPFPIAIACQRFLEHPGEDPWKEWELLSRDILQPIIQYLSHLLLSDLVETGKQPPHLFHRIQSILSRPMAGHFAGFLRETARYYRDKKLSSSVPQLVDFLLRSEVDATILPEGKALIGLLVDYRNLWAHGKMSNEGAISETLIEIRRLSALLLNELEFLSQYELVLENGITMMGSTQPKGLPDKALPIMVITAGEVKLRPLLLKLKGKELALLKDSDLRKKKLVYSDSQTHHIFKKKNIKKEMEDVYNALNALVKRVRAIDTPFPFPDWETFSERASVITDRTLSLYEDMNKYHKGWYVPRREWEGDDGIFNQFLNSDKTLLAITGEQGTGKSALVCRLVEQSRDQGHATLLYNAQRFTFAKIKQLSKNPLPEYFSNIFHYENPFDKTAVQKLLKRRDKDKQAVLFIDAINEVDGLEKNWNKFEAMLFLLEWVSEVAQPGLKIVISFRLDIYEEFEYLQPDEFPENINEISWPGTHPEKQWVTELEKFNEEQAERLYNHLQEEPEGGIGMAPSMTWDDMKAGLGGTSHEFTSNPLIFTIFLKIHNKESHVITSDKEELFTLYSEKLTGAAERKKNPLLKKLWYFFKDANITPKDRFLSNSINKMSEIGGIAFLVEDLDPKEKKVERRMLEFMENRTDSGFESLQEGGLLTEETIEAKIGGENIYARRISFVGELMVAAMGKVFQKYRNRDKLRMAAILSFVFAVLVSACFFIPPIFIDPSNPGHEIFVKILPTVTFYFLGLILALAFVYIFPGLFKKSDFQDFGTERITQKFVVESITKKFSHTIVTLTVILFIIVGILAMIKIMEFAICFFIVSLIIVSYLLFSKRGTLSVLKSLKLPFSPKLIKLSFHRSWEFFLSDAYKKTERFNTRIYLLSGIPLLMFAIIAVFIPYDKILVKSVQEMDMSSSLMIKGLAANFAHALEYLSLTLFVVSVANLMFRLISPVLEKIEERNRCMLLSDSNQLPKLLRQRSHPIIFWTAFMIFGLPVFSIGGTYLYDLYRDVVPKELVSNRFQKLTSDSFKASGCFRVSTYDHSDNDPSRWQRPGSNPGGLKIINDNLSQEEIEALHQLGNYPCRLDLHSESCLKIDLGAFPKLRELTVPGSAISSWRSDCLKKCPELESLRLINPENWLAETEGSSSIFCLEIRGKCYTLGNLQKTFRSLSLLKLEESSLNLVKESITPNEKLVLEILDKKPRLEWLNSDRLDLQQHIIVLRSVSENTDNLNRIQKLWLDINGLKNPLLLNKMESLKWLRLYNVDYGSTRYVEFHFPGKQWLDNFYDAIGRLSPRLKKLEYLRGYHGISCYVHEGVTKEQVLNRLKRSLNNQYYEFQSENIINITNRLLEAEEIPQKDFLFHRIIGAAAEIRVTKLKTKTLMAIAKSLFNAGKFQLAKKSTELIELIPGKRFEKLKIETLTAIGKAYAESGDSEKAGSVFQQVLDKAGNIDVPKIKSETIVAIGKAYAESGDTKKADSVLQQALHEAGNIDVPKIKSETIVAIGKAYAESGDTKKADSVLQQALHEAGNIDDLRLKSETIVAIGKAYAESGDIKKARPVFEEALDEAKGINDSNIKSQTLVHIGKTYAKSGYVDMAGSVFQQALHEAGNIDDLRLKSETLTAVGKAYAESGDTENAGLICQQAINNALAIKYAKVKIEILSEIATAIPSADENYDKKLQQILDEISKAEEFYRNKPEVLFNIVEVFSKVNKFQQALDTASKIRTLESYNKLKSKALVTIAKALSNIDRFQDAVNIIEEVLDRIVKVASVLNHAPYDAPDVLESVVEIFPNLRIDDQRKILKRIVYIISTVIEGQYAEYHSLWKIAKVLERLDEIQDKEYLSQQIFNYIMNSKNPGKGIKALYVIAKIKARLGNPQKAAKIYQQANEIGKIYQQANEIGMELTDLSPKVRAPHFIALAKNGKYKEALDITTDIEPDDEKSEALIAIANDMAQSNQVDNQEALLEQAMKTALGIKHPPIKSKTLASIAIAFAKSKMFQHAHDTALLIDNDWNKAQALAGISIAMAQYGEFGDAIVKVEGIEYDQHKVNAFTEIAKSMAKKGKGQEASMLFKQAIEVVSGQI